MEICANCGKIAKNHRDEFRCAACGSHVSVVVPAAMFRKMVEEGLAKE